MRDDDDDDDDDDNDTNIQYEAIDAPNDNDYHEPRPQNLNWLIFFKVTINPVFQYVYSNQLNQLVTNEAI